MTTDFFPFAYSRCNDSQVGTKTSCLNLTVVRLVRQVSENASEKLLLSSSWNTKHPLIMKRPFKLITGFYHWPSQAFFLSSAQERHPRHRDLLYINQKNTRNWCCKGSPPLGQTGGHSDSRFTPCLWYMSSAEIIIRCEHPQLPFYFTSAKSYCITYIHFWSLTT